MDKVRICHTADFHFGANVNGSRELNQEIKKNLIRSLDQIVKSLNMSKVDLMLIAGDFFESSSTDYNLLNDVKEILASFNGRIVIAPGNHDYVSLESVYLDKWPGNVDIFTSEEIDHFEYDDLKTRVYGFAFNHSHIYDRKLVALKDFDIDQDFINIGLFHGQIDESLNAYNPIYKEDIEKSGLDYIALGHIHKRTEVQKLGRTYYAYSGNPLGRSFNETGQKGIYLGDISKNHNGLNFYKLDGSEFHIVNIEVDRPESQGQVLELIEKTLVEDFGQGYRKNYYKLILKGFVSSDFKLNLDFIKDGLSHITYVELVDSTRIEVDIDSLMAEKSLKGIFVKNVLVSKMDDRDKDLVIDIGMKAFEDLL